VWLWIRRDMKQAKTKQKKNRSLEIIKNIRPEIKYLLQTNKKTIDYLTQLQCMTLTELYDVELVDYLNILVLDYLQCNIKKPITFVKLVLDIHKEIRNRKL